MNGKDPALIGRSRYRVTATVRAAKLSGALPAKHPITPSIDLNGGDRVLGLIRTTVNYHLTKRCNYACRFCFAPFADIHAELDHRHALELVRHLARALSLEPVSRKPGGQHEQGQDSERQHTHGACRRSAHPERCREQLVRQEVEESSVQVHASGAPPRRRGRTVFGGRCS
jgi:hypothetical protein